MTEPLSCLASVDALLAAPPDELAAAVMVFGLAHTVDVRPLDRRVEVSAVVAALARAAGMGDVKPGFALLRALQGSPLADVAEAVAEGVIFGEQRLCLARSVTNEGLDQVRLLRRGRDALRAGEPFRYLR